ncbi:MAG: hypothetical protein ASARMPRED_001695 [Alectoria sarmentosa]|nr:MAG: hypothetical protein ASARMPRED_001695 [Alectoria sarmentosa]
MAMAFRSLLRQLPRKPIYDDLALLDPPKPSPTPKEDSLPSSPTPTNRLAGQIKHARLFIHTHTVAAEDRLNAFMSAVLHQERSFTQTIASLAPPPETHERVMPGALYVLVAAMTGSIMSRNRNILLRATVPFAVGLGAAWTVLPVTMRNVGDLVWTYEEKVPVISINHMRIRGAVEEGWRQVKIRDEATKKWFDERAMAIKSAIASLCTIVRSQFPENIESEETHFATVESGFNSMAGLAGRHGLQDLPAELLTGVMKHLPDMAALSRLFTAYPKTPETFIEASNDIFASIVNNMSPELRNSALDVLAVRSHPPIHPRQITHFIKHHLDAEVYNTQIHLRSYSLSALLDLIVISESIENLTESFARDRVRGPSMQHKEESSSREGCDIKSRSTRQFVQYQNKETVYGSVPDWLQCRGEAYRPEALSRFLSNLSSWEHQELEAVQFHLAHEVNRIQYFRSCGSEDRLFQQPVLLQRLIRDIDHWDTQNPQDHVLVAAFRQSLYAKHYPIVWARVRDLYDASFPNTRRKVAMQILQNDHPQWGWCLWDEERLVKRGLIDIEYENLVKNRNMNDESQTAKIHAWRTVIGRVHRECIEAQYTLLDRRIEAQYAIDAQIHVDRIERGMVWECEPEDREWMPTEMDRIYNC